MRPTSETAFSAAGIDVRLVFEAGDAAPAVTLVPGDREVRASSRRRARLAAAHRAVSL